MNATISPTLAAEQWWYYCLLASSIATELYNLYSIAIGADDENWDWDGSEQRHVGGEDADTGQTLMAEILSTASSEFAQPEMWDDLVARVSRSRSPAHFCLQVARSKFAERVTGLSLNAFLKACRGGRPHRDVVRRRDGKLVEKIRSKHIDSVTSSTSSLDEFQSASSSPSSSTESKE